MLHQCLQNSTMPRTQDSPRRSGAPFCLTVRPRISGQNMMRSTSTNKWENPACSSGLRVDALGAGRLYLESFIERGCSWVTCRAVGYAAIRPFNKQHGVVLPKQMTESGSDVRNFGVS